MKKLLQIFVLMTFVGISAGFSQLTEDYFSLDPNSRTTNVSKENLMSGANPFEDQEVEKCATVEVMESLRQQNPNMGTDAQFEEWIAQKIEERRALPASQRRAIIRVPIVFHIIHNGTPVNTPGNVVGTNMSAAQVQSQIRVLNEDFRMQNADRANNPEWDSVAADLEIEFVPVLRHPDTGLPLAEPGINRINRNDKGWPAPPYSVAQMQSTIKPESSWDWEQTMNIWIAQLSPSGLYGYAQFPSASNLPGMPGNGGASNTDGVVVNTFTFGSDDDDDGSFTTRSTEKGRTMTHEIGHWVGLRHVWGDGGCAVDDFCDDTPRMPRSSPFGSCNPNQNTCDDTAYGASVDLKDMNANYMDYSSDSCMNLFTQDQKDRAEAVFANSPGRGSLANSPLIAPAPAEIGFYPNVGSAFEGSGLTVDEQCEQYRDVEFKLYLIGDATGGEPSVKARLSDESTATEGVDYEILAPENMEFKFENGEAGEYVFKIRIFNEAIPEADETVVFELYDFDADGSDALLSNNFKYTYTIKNDDYEPSNDNTPSLLVAENFESGSLGDWNEISFGASTNSFTVGDQAPLSNMSAYPSNDGSSYAYNGRTPTVINVLYSPVLSFGGQGGSLQFDWTGVGESISFFGRRFWYDYGFAGFIDASLDPSTFIAVTPQLGNSEELNNLVTDVPAQVTSGTWRLCLVWRNDTSIAGASPIAYDNVKIIRDNVVNFETEVTGDGSAYVNLGPNQTVHVYSKESAGSDLIASIVNNSSHDYGCTRVSVDRAGMGAKKFYDNSCENEMAFDKTVYIEPENDSKQDLEVTLYYTEEEISGWEAATGLTRDALYVVHSDAAIAAVENVREEVQFSMADKTSYNNYGVGYKGTFNSTLKGGYGLVPPSTVGIYDLMAVQNQEQIDITFTETFVAPGVKYYILEKSTDNENWEDFKVLTPGQGEYMVTDYAPVDGGNLYRIRVIGGCELYTDPAYANFKTTGAVKVYPNPTTDRITLLISNDELNGVSSIGFYNDEGQMVSSHDVTNYENAGVLRQTFDVSAYANGMYYIRANNATGKVFATFVKMD